LIAAMGQLIRLESVQSCALVVLDRPEALNALTVAMLDELAETLERVSTDTAVEVVAITGAGRAFCAGVDLKALQDRQLEGGRVGTDFDDAAAMVTNLLERMTKPTIAAVNGACFTGGLELALACDLIVAADEAVFGDTHAKWGLRPSWGMTQRLPRRIGHARARLLSYTARTFSGNEAVEYGLAIESCPAVDLRGKVLALANEIAANSAGSLAAYKSLYSLADNSFLDVGLEQERNLDFTVGDSLARVDTFSRRGKAAP
jgi:enoyl-CoA hydratase